jgi:hypothetical protein
MADLFHQSVYKQGREVSTRRREALLIDTAICHKFRYMQVHLKIKAFYAWPTFYKPEEKNLYVV